jgi:hypothetical protein
LQKKKLTFKVKDSAIKIKLEIAKLQRYLKNRGDVDVTVKEKETGSVLDGFNSIRAMFKDPKIMKISQKNNVNTKQKRETYSKIASSKTLANANKRK